MMEVIGFVLVLHFYQCFALRVDYFRFDSIFIKKNNQNWFFFFKKTKTEPKPVQTDWFRFGYFGEKTSSNRSSSVFFRFDLVFPGLTRFFSGFFSVWVQFSFFGFRLIKPKPNWTGQFFQNSNWFFFTIWFFQIFFSGFLDLISFSVFFLPLLVFQTKHQFSYKYFNFHLQDMTINKLNIQSIHLFEFNGLDS